MPFLRLPRAGSSDGYAPGRGRVDGDTLEIWNLMLVELDFEILADDLKMSDVSAYGRPWCESEK